MNNKTKKLLNSTLIQIVLLIGAVVMIVPFLWMFLTSFKTISESTQMNPFVIFPSKWRLDAFKSVMSKMNFLRLYWNTLVLIAGRIFFAVITATMAGYALGRLKFPGRSLAFGLVLFQMMVPAQIFIIPQYLMVSKMGMLNTSFALIFPGLVTAFGTFLLRQAYMSLPKDLEEAAVLDGCGVFARFLFVMLPLTRSSMVALGIFTALFAFKDLMWPLVVNTEQTTMPLSAALAKIQGQFTSDYPELMAASMLACVPMIIIYILFQKQFIEGIATSGSKM
ncbi:MAG: multiple sugar transport system permease protein [Clostridiales bacterium]|jgi:multiple sugar transport system permease protein|nr:ABC-type transporter, integral rane subunit [Oscillospiraceae bacterium]MDN5378875.1 multiple sugar transport system permease protein [Clostridiales bacterium]